MWICRRCAAHVKDDVLKCPSCATAAPARLQPELANHVSCEARDPPRRGEIRWLIRRAIPNLRRQAKSTRLLAKLGIAAGLICALINVALEPRLPTSHGFVFLQAIVYPIALPIIFVLFGVMLQLVRGDPSQWERRWPARFYDVGAILGFFTPLLVGLILTSPREASWDSLNDLLIIIFVLVVMGAFCGFMGALFFIALSILLEPYKNRVARFFGFKRDPKVLLPLSTFAKTDSLGRDQSNTEANRTGIVDLDQPDRLAITDGKSDIQPNEPI
jgi:hypothetical protein